MTISKAEILFYITANVQLVLRTELGTQHGSDLIDDVQGSVGLQELLHHRQVPPPRSYHDCGPFILPGARKRAALDVHVTSKSREVCQGPIWQRWSLNYLRKTCLL